MTGSAVLKPKGESSYKTYLIFKKVIDRLRESPCTRNQLGTSLEVKIDSIDYTLRLLLAQKVTRVMTFDTNSGRKRKVYELVKDE